MHDSESCSSEEISGYFPHLNNLALVFLFTLFPRKLYSIYTLRHEIERDKEHSRVGSTSVNLRKWQHLQLQTLAHNDCFLHSLLMRYKCVSDEESMM